MPSAGWRIQPWPPAVALEVYTAAGESRGSEGLGAQLCKCLGPAAGSEVDAFGLKEEQVGSGLTAGTQALLFLTALPLYTCIQCWKMQFTTA